MFIINDNSKFDTSVSVESLNQCERKDLTRDIFAFLQFRDAMKEQIEPTNKNLEFDTFFKTLEKNTGEFSQIDRLINSNALAFLSTFCGDKEFINACYTNDFGAECGDFDHKFLMIDDLSFIEFRQLASENKADLRKLLNMSYKLRPVRLKSTFVDNLDKFRAVVVNMAKQQLVQESFLQPYLLSEEKLTSDYVHNQLFANPRNYTISKGGKTLERREFTPSISDMVFGDVIIQFLNHPLSKTVNDNNFYTLFYDVTGLYMTYDQVLNYVQTHHPKSELLEQVINLIPKQGIINLFSFGDEPQKAA